MAEETKRLGAVHKRHPQSGKRGLTIAVKGCSSDASVTKKT